MPLVSAIPHKGQRSIVLSILYSSVAIFPPLVNVIFEIFNLSFSNSYTIFIIPSVVIDSFVTMILQLGYAVANSVLKASPMFVF